MEQSHITLEAHSEESKDDAQLEAITPGRLALKFIYKFQGSSRMQDLEIAITHLGHSLELHPPGDPDRHIPLTTLGYALLLRFQHTSYFSDLEASIEHHRESVTICNSEHPEQSIGLHHLAMALLTRFKETGKTEDLDESILFNQQALVLRPPGHAQRSVSMGNLAAAILARYDKTGAMTDLEEVIELNRHVLQLRQHGHPDRADALTNLVCSVTTRYQETGTLEHLDEAIALHHQALELLPEEHPGRPLAVNQLAVSTILRYNAIGRADDLEDAVRFSRNALELRPPGHSGRSHSLSSLAAIMLIHFQQRGEMSVLEESIMVSREALELCLSGHPRRSEILSNLALALHIRYKQTGANKDFDEAILLHREAIDLRPPGDPNRYISLNNLVFAGITLFEQTGIPEDLDTIVKMNHESLNLLSPSHPNRSTSLSNLSSSIALRFEQSYQMADLEEAIRLNSCALELRPPGHPLRSTSLNNIANYSFRKFEHTGKVECLEDCIIYNRLALELRPLGHPERSDSLSNLALALYARYEHMGKMDDLVESMQLNVEALKLRPDKHPDSSKTLNNLATATRTLFEAKGGMEILDMAVKLNRLAVQRRSVGHADRWRSVMNLGLTMRTRFWETMLLSDLQEVIKSYSESLQLCPPGHRNLTLSLYYLAISTQTLYEKLGVTPDLYDATEHLRNAKIAVAAKHPVQRSIDVELALVHRRQYIIDPSPETLSAIFSFFQSAANHSTASVKTRFETALLWTSVAQELKHESILLAHSLTLSLLTRYLLATPSVELQHRFFALTETVPKTLATDAAARAITLGKLETAVEFLEQGRTMLWSEMRSYRHPLEDLRKVDLTLADEFQQLSVQIEHQAMSSEIMYGLDGTSIPLEVRQRDYRILSEKWDAVLERIRQLDGFTNFLKTMPFSTLQTAAVHGPVIVVNVSSNRSDAIIVLDGRAPVLVPLPYASVEALSRLSSVFLDPRASTYQQFSIKLLHILRTLWDIVVSLVVDRLEELGVEKNSRIWWCQTSHLCALPLHATGQYAQKTKPLPDHYISSYTSSLSVLIEARSGMMGSTVPPTESQPKLLVIGDTGNLDAAIPSVEEELRSIKSLNNTAQILFCEEANRTNVLAQLPFYHWVHFACHGHRNPESFHSQFQLYDGEPLELIDLVKARLPNAQLAFLSACHAAAADIQGTPDEVIHLAGALQFAGFRSVVGTMWAMADEDGPDVAKDFYQYMLREPGKVGDFRDAAVALNLATREMRKRKLPLGRWVNFVHIGA